jgi:hypothetical protein
VLACPYDIWFSEAMLQQLKERIPGVQVCEQNWSGQVIGLWDGSYGVFLVQRACTA